MTVTLSIRVAFGALVMVVGSFVVVVGSSVGCSVVLMMGWSRSDYGSTRSEFVFLWILQNFLKHGKISISALQACKFTLLLILKQIDIYICVLANPFVPVCLFVTLPLKSTFYRTA